MTDPRIAALAEALRKWGGPGHSYWRVPAYPYERTEQTAAAILAALPPDWCGHHAALIESSKTTVARDVEIRRLNAECDEITEEALGYRAEIARLREIEVASQQCSGSPKHYGGCGCLCHAALEEKP